MHLQVARHILELQSGMKYSELKQYISSQKKIESYGSALHSFKQTLDMKEKFKKMLAKRKSACNFARLFQGMKAFNRQMPLSFQFYPKEKATGVQKNALSDLILQKARFQYEQEGLTWYTEFLDEIMDVNSVSKKAQRRIHKCTTDFILAHFLMIRKGWNARFKMLRFMRKIQPRKKSARYYALGKTLKLAKQAYKFFEMLERSLLIEAKKSAKQQTLKYFLAKRLQSMLSQINRATIQMHDTFKINYENDTDTRKRINRLKTMQR